MMKLIILFALIQVVFVDQGVDFLHKCRGEPHLICEYQGTGLYEGCNDEATRLTFMRLDNVTIDLSCFPRVKNVSFTRSPYDSKKSCKHILNHLVTVEVRDGTTAIDCLTDLISTSMTTTTTTSTERTRRITTPVTTSTDTTTSTKRTRITTPFATDSTQSITTQSDITSITESDITSTYVQHHRISNNPDTATMDTATVKFVITEKGFAIHTSMEGAGLFLLVLILGGIIFESIKIRAVSKSSKLITSTLKQDFEPQEFEHPTSTAAITSVFTQPISTATGQQSILPPAIRSSLTLEPMGQQSILPPATTSSLTPESASTEIELHTLSSPSPSTTEELAQPVSSTTKLMPKEVVSKYDLRSRSQLKF